MNAKAYENYRMRDIVGEQTAWQSLWLTSHRFYHLTDYRRYGYNRIPEFNSDIQNIHTLFRKEFTLPDKKIRSAKLFITGDDIYKLYLNGNFVGEGPAQSYPFAYNYNCYDVTDLLKSGQNAIGVHLYYQGLFNIYLMSADNLCGMIAQLEITYQDSETQVIASDRTWKYTECDAYSATHIYGYQTQFSEDIDLSNFPYGWAETGFNDETWKNAYIPSNPYPPEYTLVPQITPTAQREKIYPLHIKKIENGYFFDFGKEYAGSLAFPIQGKKGQKIELRCGEELTENGRVRFELRANCTYQETITLSGKEDFVDFFDYKGYRYAEILNTDEHFNPSAVYTLSRNYPFPAKENTARFVCSDENMNKIWEICANAVQYGTQDTYYDCPTREKGGFIGDALVTGLTHLILTADARIYKKFILDMLYSSRYSPALACHVPSYNINICADYSALAPLFLDIYYQYTGDKEFLAKTLPIAEGVWEYYSQFLENGLIRRIRHMPKVPEYLDPLLVDWPQSLRDGYDLKSAKDGASTLHNVYFYGFLTTTGKLYRIIGNEKRAKYFDSIAQELKQRLIEENYDFSLGLFKDATNSEHMSLHANVLPLFYNFSLPNGYEPMKNLIMEKKLACGSYLLAFLLLQGLYQTGYDELAFTLLNNKEKNSWYTMLQHGATACAEVWHPDQKGNISWCHPGSSSPIYFYTCEIMGVKIGQIGLKSLKITPHIPKSLSFIELDLPLPSGKFSARFHRENGKAIYEYSAPNDIKVSVEGENIEFIKKDI